MPKERQFSIPLFPKFLLPTTTFRSTATQRAKHDPSVERFASGRSRRSEKYLDGHVSYLRCSRCGVDLCLTSQIISKGFTGRHGRAYLVSPKPSASAVSVNASSSAAPTDSLPNTVIQKPVPRQLVTGAHTVSDISCAFCGSVLGWKYVAAEEEGQRYKVGKSILETKRVTASSCWEGVPSNPDFAAAAFERPPPCLPSHPEEDEEETAPVLVGGDRIEFDSQDEDECEDLFAGIWSPELAARRRRRKLEHRPGMSVLR